jgi:uncharacterized protein YeaO (DUF488 family)
MIAIKRAYEKASAADGRRILVDRLWPRGVSKEKIKIDGWAKEVAPSDKLRTWFGHDPKRWAEFKRRYSAELRSKKHEMRTLLKGAKRLTLVYGAKDTEHNHALVLRAALERLL